MTKTATEQILELHAAVPTRDITSKSKFKKYAVMDYGFVTSEREEFNLMIALLRRRFYNLLDDAAKAICDAEEENDAEWIQNTLRIVPWSDETVQG